MTQWTRMFSEVPRHDMSQNWERWRQTSPHGYGESYCSQALCLAVARWIRQLNFTDSPELEQLAWTSEYTSSVRLHACVFGFSAWLRLFSHFREYISMWVHASVVEDLGLGLNILSSDAVVVLMWRLSMHVKDIHSPIGSESCLWVSYILSSFLKGEKLIGVWCCCGNRRRSSALWLIMRSQPSQRL